MKNKWIDTLKKRMIELHNMIVKYRKQQDEARSDERVALRGGIVHKLEYKIRYTESILLINTRLYNVIMS